MKRQFSIVAIILIVCTLLSACSAPKITLQDIPVYPKAGDSDTNNVYVFVISTKEFADYKIEGPNNYFIRNLDIKELTLDDFYKKELTALDWKSDEQSMVLSPTGVFCVTQTWSKGSQIIYLATCPYPMNQDLSTLTVYLLTK